MPHHETAVYYGDPKIWAIMLIAIGIIWFLWEAGVLAPLNFLKSLWPLAFIVFGIMLWWSASRQT